MTSDDELFNHISSRFKGKKTPLECTMTKKAFDKIAAGLTEVADAILALPAQERTDTSDLVQRLNALNRRYIRKPECKQTLTEAATAITERDDTIIRQAAEIERLRDEAKSLWNQGLHNCAIAEKHKARAETADRKLDEISTIVGAKTSIDRDEIKAIRRLARLTEGK